MANADKAKYLNGKVESAMNISDLELILSEIDIHDIKEFLIEKLQSMNGIDIQKLYHKVVCIHDILSQDNIKCILEFLIFDPTIKLVNKQFKQLAELNENQQYLKYIHEMENSTELHQGKTMKFNAKKNAIYLIHPKRSSLSNVETKLGFVSVHEHCKEIYKECVLQHGDLLFEYTVDNVLCKRPYICILLRYTLDTSAAKEELRFVLT